MYRKKPTAIYKTQLSQIGAEVFLGTVWCNSNHSRVRPSVPNQSYNDVVSCNMDAHAQQRDGSAVKTVAALPQDPSSVLSTHLKL